jgi:hypothetical protein
LSLNLIKGAEADLVRQALLERLSECCYLAPGGSHGAPGAVENLGDPIRLSAEVAHSRCELIHVEVRETQRSL